MFQHFPAILDDTVRELLQEAEVSQPPVDALRIARTLGVNVAFDGRQQERGRFKRLGGRPAVFLKPDERPERLQWAAAHELGEMVADRLLETVDDFAGEISPRLREETANRFASRLLLPERWFPADAASLDHDVPALKHRYRTASHELIALRLLDLPLPAVISIFDQGAITRRRGNQSRRPPRLQIAERDCWRRVHDDNRPTTMTTDELTVIGWPVHEPGWKREILRTVPRSCGDVCDEDAGW
jgi:Zn-dependent peptidase ImmA (M78 family)